jgi:hypothetical protein
MGSIKKASEAATKYDVEDMHYPKSESSVITGLKLVDNSLPVCNLAKNVHYVKHIRLRNDDCFITGYPKSGTTWLAEIVWLLVNNLDFEKSRSLSHLIRNPFLDYGLSHAHLDELSSPRTLNTRLPANYLPDNVDQKCKVVYIMRNPKDCLVSNFHYLSKHKYNTFSGTLEELVDGFAQGRLWYGPWWDHIDSFMSLPNVHVIQYENLLEVDYYLNF